MIEDSCDALGATLRGTPTGTRSDISVTSFALVAHHHRRRAPAAWCCSTTTSSIDRCLLLRRWGRRSEVQFFGSKKGDKRFFSEVDGIEYDNLFIFDEVGWNFEPSRDQRRVRARAARQAPGEPRPPPAQLRPAVRRSSAPTPTCSCCRAQLDGLETGWHMFPVLIRPESGIRRAEFQQHMEAHGIDTRMVWTGNATRQPAFAKVPHRAPERRAARTPTGSWSRG